MKENEDLTPATEKGLVAPVTEASLRLGVTDLLLSRHSEGLALAQNTVLEQIEAALEAYRSYFYPLVTASEADPLPRGVWGGDVVKEEA